ncbi:hypothetical protein CMI47_10605 [Candidatus Pacearchaeota archaeon]|nr:hypothetical protein [Candidatus Pacearchaeota archaeon]|tara:strand:+ start:2008 stop:2370 length:363 start_codon:yes stop_codon:yes gene_type:complete
MANVQTGKTFFAKKITLTANTPRNIMGGVSASATDLLFAQNCYSLTLINEGTVDIYMDFFPYGTVPGTISASDSLMIPRGIAVTLNTGVSSERTGYQNPWFMSTAIGGVLRTLQICMNRM